MCARARRQYNLIPLLLDVSKRAIKEKVIRVALASFRNLVTKAPKANLAPMLVAKVFPYVQTLQGRKFSDDEIRDDVEFLVDELKSSFAGLTCVARSRLLGSLALDAGRACADESVEGCAQDVRRVQVGARVGRADVVAAAQERRLLARQRAQARRPRP